MVKNRKMKNPYLTTPTGEPPQTLMRALAHLLRPLLRVLIAYGVTLPVLVRLLKELYVDVAEEAFPLPGKRQTDSRLNLLTDVHRKDIRALRGRRPASHRPSAVVSRNAQMMTIWAGDPEFLDEHRQRSGLPMFVEKLGIACPNGHHLSVAASRQTTLVR